MNMAIGTFEVLDFAAERNAAELAAGRLSGMFGPDLGFMSSSIFVDMDAAAVVHCAQWPAQSREADRSAELVRALGAEAGARSVRTFTGTLAADIEGGSPRESPGVCVLAIRHVNDGNAARELSRLLVSTGTWKREVPGFIGASAYITPDGREFLNYPRWVDEAAYDAYMADPRIAEGQAGISVLESAKPEFIRGRSLSQVGGRR